MSAIATYVNEGDSIDYTPGSDVTAGDVIDLGNFVGIATSDIASGVLGSLVVEGVFDVNKYDSEAITLGAPVYWDAGTSTATGTSGYSEAVMGVCVKAADASDATVRVRISPYPA